ncbi:MAG: RNA polymerase sigma factor [Lachnospiraceae bacterium]|nr:RNA polymerase sigma factor [Lachnospiraceae bacterium]
MTREDELMQKIEQGDIRAVNELIEMFYSDILRYCLWHTPDRSLAEDAVQETFLKVIRYFDRYTHKGRFKSFLYQVAANTCTDIWRKNRRTDVSLEGSEIDFAYSEQKFEDIQSDMAFKQFVNGLPEDLQEIVLLRYGQDLTMREIAEALNMPLRTVQSRLRSALKKIKKEFENGGLL